MLLNYESGNNLALELLSVTSFNIGKLTPPLITSYNIFLKFENQITPDNTLRKLFLARTLEAHWAIFPIFNIYVVLFALQSCPVAKNILSGLFQIFSCSFSFIYILLLGFQQKYDIAVGFKCKVQKIGKKLKVSFLSADNLENKAKPHLTPLLCSIF